jgi:rubrerythrin
MGGRLAAVRDDHVQHHCLTRRHKETEAADIARYRENLQGEIDAIALYSLLAEKEDSRAVKDFYVRMVEVESIHAGVWRAQLEAAGVNTSGMGPAWRLGC